MALINTMSSGISALKSTSRGLEVIGNNIANVNTPGFKRSRTGYEDSFSNMLRSSSPSVGDNGSNVTASQIGLGVQVAHISHDYGQGAISQTGVKTDLAIDGKGWFQVRDSLNGELFGTRMGTFRLDDRGYLVNQNGLRVQGLTGGSVNWTVTNTIDPGTGNPIFNFTPTFEQAAHIGDIRINTQLSEADGTLVNNTDDGTGNPFPIDRFRDIMPQVQDWVIGQQGNIAVTFPNQDSHDFGQIFLMQFRDENALVHEGGGLVSNFSAAGLIGSPVLSAASNTAGLGGLGTIQSEALELSNVDLTEEFADMITTQRSFQAGSRIITVSDDILQEIVNLKR